MLSVVLYRLVIIGEDISWMIGVVSIQGTELVKACVATKVNKVPPSCTFWEECEANSDMSYDVFIYTSVILGVEISELLTAG